MTSGRRIAHDSVSMNEAMVLTVGRMALAPVFFLLYQLAGAGSPWLVLGCWVVFGLIEISDLLDGAVARRLGKVTELGKILDPLADAVSRLTYFVCFAGSGIMPLWVLLILVYRDLCVAYVRVLFARNSVMLPARPSGKLKALVYALAGIAGLAVFTLQALDIFGEARRILAPVTYGLMSAAAAVAIWSLADYWLALPRKNRRSGT